MTPIFDLRSDTVTRPSPAMVAAMMAAAPDDDAYGDCPAVGALETRVADLLGKPQGLWVPTGTMANQLAVGIHGQRGQALACAPMAHVQIHENASAAGLWGLQAMPIGTPRGFDGHELAELLGQEASGWPRVGLVWLENTLGSAGGTIWPLARLRGVAEVATGAGRPLHLDGARLWNAHVATGIPLHEWATMADTVSVALSKGLGAPAGSVLCGPSALIARARELKHALGGAMRQGAGLLAAAGLYALDHHLADLAADHRRAHRLAAALADLPHWSVQVPETNLVLARVQPPVTSAESLCGPLRRAGIRCYPNTYAEVRLAVHRDLSDAAIDQVIATIRGALGTDPGKFATPPV